MILKIKEYSDKEKGIIKKKMLVISLSAIILLCINILLKSTQGLGFIKESLLLNIQNFSSGLILGVLVLNGLYLSGLLDNVRQLKLKVFKKSKA